MSLSVRKPPSHARMEVLVPSSICPQVCPSPLSCPSTIFFLWLCPFLPCSLPPEMSIHRLSPRTCQMDGCLT